MECERRFVARGCHGFECSAAASLGIFLEFGVKQSTYAAASKIWMDADEMYITDRGYRSRCETKKKPD